MTKYTAMTDAEKTNFTCNLDSPIIMANLLARHTFAEQRIGELELLICRLVDSGNAAIKGFYSNWDSCLDDVIKLTGYQGEQDDE